MPTALTPPRAKPAPPREKPAPPREKPAGARFDRPLKGIVLMFTATFFFALMHTMIRHMTDLMHPFEVAFFRNVFGLLFVLPWIVRYGLEPLRTEHFGLHALRAGLNVVAMLAFFYALSVVPLAEVTALGFTAPIFATILATLLLGEVLMARRWIAVAIGFLGTLLILRPGLVEGSLGQLAVLMSSIFWACALLTIKTLGRTDSSITIITYMSLLMIPLSFVPALFFWTWPSLEMLLWLLAIGLIGGGAQWLMTESLRVADTSVVMPVDFCKLPWTALLGYLAFAQVPDIYTWIGGLVIFASALCIAYRERQPRAATSEAR